MRSRPVGLTHEKCGTWVPRRCRGVPSVLPEGEPERDGGAGGESHSTEVMEGHGRRSRGIGKTAARRSGQVESGAVVDLVGGLITTDKGLIHTRSYTDCAVPACSRADVIKLQPQSHLQSHHGSHFLISNHLILLTKTHTHEPLMGSGAGSGKIRERPGANCVFRLRHVFLRHTCRVGSLPSNSSCGRPRHGVAPDAIAVVAVLGSGSPRRSADRHPGVGTRPTLLPTPPRRPPQPSTVSTSPTGSGG